MKVNYFDINIIDMQENAQVVSLEKTALGNPALIYNGADNLHQLIMTSELHFSFLQQELNSIKYNHLFTGSEVRYKVELIDDSVYNYPKVIWCGYLLPEQFSEPYKAKDYFIDFIATDGIGLLKDKEFTSTIDISSDTKISILDVINQCLLKTGLVLPIRFAEAIQSVVFELEYLQLEVDVLAYKEDSSYQDVFTVLENCLTFLGCKIFQLDGCWYVTGLNQQKENTVVYKQYEYNINTFKLVYVKEVVVSKELVTSPILEGANIALIPPYKTVTAKWDAEFLETLIPEDVVSHLPVNLSSDPNDLTAKYWDVITDKGAFIFVFYYVVDNGPYIDQYYNGYIATSTQEEGNPFEGLIYQGEPILCLRGNNQTMVFSDLENNYIQYEDYFYIDADEDLERCGSLQIEFQIGTFSSDTETAAYFNNEGVFNSLSNNGVGLTRVNSTSHNLETGDYILVESSADYTGEWEVTKIDGNTFDISASFVANNSGTWKINPFKNIFHFAVVCKKDLNDAPEEIYLSNFETSGVPSRFYDFNITLVDGIVKCVLNIEKILFIKSCFYNVRFYYPVTHSIIGVGYFLYLNIFKFTLNKESSFSVLKTRSIDFTSNILVSNFHSCTVLENTNRNSFFSASLQSSMLGAGVSFRVYKAVEDLFVIDGANKRVVFTVADVSKIKVGYKIYKKQIDVTNSVGITNFYISEDDIDFGVVYVDSNKLNFLTITNTEEIQLKLPATLPNAHSYRMFKNLWSRKNVQEIADWQDCLVMIYHDLYEKTSVRCTGETTALVGPLDLVNLYYNQENKQCTPTNININLSEGITQVTIVENQQNIVSDYV